MARKIKLLFLCTGNACRSQMAEGLGRHFLGRKVDVYSAGIEKHGLNPNAVKVMDDIGIDISQHYSKTVDELDVEFDFVITVCGHAHETCPVFSGNAQVIHHGFDDPPKLAANALSEDEALVHYSRVRDEIKAYLLNLSIGLE